MQLTEQELEKLAEKLNIEALPWRVEIFRVFARPHSAHVVAAKDRVVLQHVFPSGESDRYGRRLPEFGAKATVTEIRSPGIVASCGVSYAGLAGETIVRHADLIAAAPELYGALEMLLKSVQELSGFNYRFAQYPGIELHPDAVRDFERAWEIAKAALAKAQGESTERV